MPKRQEGMDSEEPSSKAESDADAIGWLLLIAGFSLIVASIWMMRGPLLAGLVAGMMLFYAATLVVRRD